MLKKAAVIGLTGLALGAAPAAAGSIGNGETVALTMIGGVGLMSIGCMAIALLTQDDEDDQESYDRRGFYVALSGSYARENFSESAVLNLVDGELQDNLGNPPGITFNLDEVDSDVFGVTGRGGYRCHPNVSAELQFESLDDFEGTISVPGMETFDLELESLVFTTNAKAHLLTGRYQPFVLAGVGFMRMESKARSVTGPVPQASDRTVNVAMRFGGGLDFYLTRNVVASVEASYLMPTGKLDNLDYYSIGLGLQYRF